MVEERATAKHSRKDIDGLRAIAVLPVVLFHAGVPWFTGGFVGVDVFFVISGFLITGIILRDDFSLVGFYERRVRRIAPALAVMMLVVAALGWLILLPHDLEDLGQSMVATTGFSSNILFYIETNYFANNESKLLLHTWSLAVEEQFYIFFPLFVMGLKRWAPGFIRPALIGLAVASFLISSWLAYYQATAAFYLPHSRAWELLVGGIVATYPRSDKEVPSALGLVGILASFFLLTETSIFPGLTAAPAVVGTALIIWAGGKSATSRLLAAKPLVRIGLISYSLYLWHWPMLVFLRYRFILPEWWQTALVLGLTFVVSYLSWKYVENPVRGRRFSRKTVFVAGAGTAAVLLAIGGALIVPHPGRLSPQVAQLAKMSAYTPDVTKCQTVGGGKLCGSGTALIWGDSHARALLPVASGYVAAASGCPPAVGTELRSHYVACKPYDDAVLAFIKKNDIRTVILAANWDSYLKPHKFAVGSIRSGMRQTFAELRGREVYVMATVPGAKTGVSSALARMAEFHTAVDIRRSAAEYLVDERPVLTMFRGQRILYPHLYLCGALCAVQGVGPLYSDNAHLTPEGAARLAPMLKAASMRQP